ncbi:hypothetical protein BCR43DRAFT_16620 [Syncephalastrum racemosum]|uniref:F-box domain-containing protein n=1 Tax=Syncephalastrum racemosum TaxID=13706 RepID=A0A1X2HSQ9_SYNRA|nr:hypothetical protein BCR43DRAFT_16620 [Syncephalastrum racemosum]
MCIKRLLEAALDSVVQEDQAQLEETVQKAWTAILDQRAAYLCKTNQFNEAMKYADKLIRLNPTSSEGYRRKADIYYARLQYRHVPYLYRTCMALSLNGEEKSTIIARISEAQLRQRSKADPFHILPLEVLETVFRFLEVQDRLSCLMVCQRWRNCLLQLSSLWDDLTLDLSHVRKPDYASFDLPYLGPRLRRLQLTHHPIILDHAFPMLAHHCCSNITSLGRHD